MPQTSYSFLDSSKTAVFLLISHLDLRNPIGHIYASKKTGQKATLKLMNSLRNPEGKADFQRVAGFSSVYIANAVDPEKASLLEQEFLAIDRNLPVNPLKNLLSEAEKHLKSYIT